MSAPGTRGLGTKETKLTKQGSADATFLRLFRRPGQELAPSASAVSASTPSAESTSHVAESEDLIYGYSRAQALADGVLVDVTKEAGPEGMLGGFTVPVAVTSALWAAIESIPPSLVGLADARGRLHDVLWMASCAARRARGTSFVSFVVILPTRGSRQRNRTLAAAIGPDDDGRPCVTIGFPEDF